jgi:hypothetical protein
MSLRIDVRTPPQLIERAREQQQQQRLAMVERQRQTRVRKEAERQVVRERLIRGQNAKGERVTDGIELSGKRPWYGAQADTKYAFIVICNINEARDDVFEILVNGEKVGVADFSADQRTGYLIRWPSRTLKDKAAKKAVSEFLVQGGDTNGPVDFAETMDAIGVRPSVSSPINFSMQNIKQNNNGNYGSISWGTVDSGSRLVKIASPREYFQGETGESFSKQLYWSNLMPVIPRDLVL